MEMEERNSLVQNLEFLAKQLYRFEQQYNLVKSLPSNKSTVFSDQHKKAVKGVTTGASFVGSFVLGLVIMFIPSLIIAGTIVGLIFRVTNSLNGGVSVLLWAVFWLSLSAGFAVIVSKNTGKFAAKKMNDHNKNAVVNNDNVDKQIAIAEQNCNAIRKEIDGYDLSWYPPDYFYSEAAESFAKYLKNMRANSLGEAVNLYEEEKYRNNMTDLQRQQLTAAWTQCILQAQTIGAINTQGQSIRNEMRTQGQLNRATINSAASSINQGINNLRNDINRRF